MAPKELLLVHQRYGYESVILGTEGYTTVQTVFRVVSNLTAFASVGFKFVSYMGFSNEACPLLFSCPAYPLYCTFGLVLGKKKDRKLSSAIRHSNISTLSTYNSKCPEYCTARGSSLQVSVCNSIYSRYISHSMSLYLHTNNKHC